MNRIYHDTSINCGAFIERRKLSLSLSGAMRKCTRDRPVIFGYNKMGLLCFSACYSLLQRWFSSHGCSSLPPVGCHGNQCLWVAQSRDLVQHRYSLGEGSWRCRFWRILGTDRWQNSEPRVVNRKRGYRDVQHYQELCG